MTEERNHILNINIGILGHVDSGKTSLVKALSTSLSTAALDKHPQSQQRGITLDLGFSAFTLPINERIASLLIERYGTDHGYELLQFTLVDCPGHASLIRTIIGGAQIIDMMILVVDANKGIQPQTAECIVIGEITTDILIIALNKIDLLPTEERSERIARISRKIKKTLASTKFADVLIIPICASIGGEKVASIVNPSSGPSQKSAIFKSNVASEGIEQLVEAIHMNVPIPTRNVSQPFYFSIDHCFPIKGHGTVMTGTILSGMVQINQTIEIPSLQLQKRVKSMQMFHKPVKYAQQGDRVGICVTNLDSKLLERGIAATPNTVPLIASAIVLVKKIRFFKFPCKSQQKFHISIGHETIVASAIFFGGSEIATKLQKRKEEKAGISLKKDNSESSDLPSSHSTLTVAYQRLFPSLDFDWSQDYQYQNEMIETEGLQHGNEPLQWVLLQFQQPAFCPVGSLIIGSRLNLDLKESAHTGTSNTATSAAATPNTQHCRLAFYGPIRGIITQQAVTSTSPEEQLSKLQVFIWKQKECEVCRLTDIRGPMVHEVIGWKLISGAGVNIHHYIGMKVMTEKGIIGSIVSAYGTEGKFRVKFTYGAKLKVGDKLIFKFKKYLYDKSKKIDQALDEETANDELQRSLVEEEMKQMELIEPTIMEAERNDKDKEEGVKKTATNPKVQKAIMKEKKKQEELVQLKMTALAEQEEQKRLKAPTSTTPPVVELMSNSVLTIPEPKPVSSPPIAPPTNSNPSDTSLSPVEVRTGKIESIKSETTAAEPTQDYAIISGAFRMEENIRNYIGCECLTETGGRGEVVGPFGKLGKCKVRFPAGCKAPVASTVKIHVRELR